MQMVRGAAVQMLEELEIGDWRTEGVKEVIWGWVDMADKGEG